MGLPVLGWFWGVFFGLVGTGGGGLDKNMEMVSANLINGDRPNKPMWSYYCRYAHLTVFT